MTIHRTSIEVYMSIYVYKNRWMSKDSSLNVNSFLWVLFKTTVTCSEKKMFIVIQDILVRGSRSRVAGRRFAGKEGRINFRSV